MDAMNNMHLLIKDARDRRGFRTQGELAERIVAFCHSDTSKEGT